jgi:hypothetical protein
MIELRERIKHAIEKEDQTTPEQLQQVLNEHFSSIKRPKDKEDGNH